MLNVQTGIIKDLQKQGFLTELQMKTAINIIEQGYKITNQMEIERKVTAS